MKNYLRINHVFHLHILLKPLFAAVEGFLAKICDYVSSPRFQNWKHPHVILSDLLELKFNEPINLSHIDSMYMNRNSTLFYHFEK